MIGAGHALGSSPDHSYDGGGGAASEESRRTRRSSTLDTATSELAVAQAAYNLAQTQHEKLSIKAPFPGVSASARFRPAPMSPPARRSSISRRSIG